MRILKPKKRLGFGEAESEAGWNMAFFTARGAERKLIVTFRVIHPGYSTESATWGKDPLSATLVFLCEPGHCVGRKYKKSEITAVSPEISP
jgi:hypothetical protein